MLRGDETIGAEVVGHGHGIELFLLVGFRHFDDDVQRRGLVVDDAESDAVIVQSRSDVVIRSRRLQQSRRVIVQQHLSAPRETRKRKDAADVAAGDDARGEDHAVVIECTDEAHFVAPRQADGGANGRRSRLREAVRDGGFQGGARHP
jgi:hypothetical protein